MQINAKKKKKKSLEVVTLGGAESDVASVVLENKPGGIETFGDIVVDTQDSAGNTRTVAFSRPTSVPIYVDIELEVSPTFPADGDLQLEELIVSYIGGTDRDGNNVPGTNVGENVIHSRIIGEIYKIPGINDIVSLEIGIVDNPTGTSNIEIDGDSVAETDTVKIDVIHI